MYGGPCYVMFLVICIFNIVSLLSYSVSWPPSWNKYLLTYTLYLIMLCSYDTSLFVYLLSVGSLLAFYLFNWHVNTGEEKMAAQFGCCWPRLLNVYLQILMRYGFVNPRVGRRQTVHFRRKDGQCKKYDYDTEGDTFQRCRFGSGN